LLKELGTERFDANIIQKVSDTDKGTEDDDVDEYGDGDELYCDDDEICKICNDSKVVIAIINRVEACSQLSILHSFVCSYHLRLQLQHRVL